MHVVLKQCLHQRDYERVGIRASGERLRSPGRSCAARDLRRSIRSVKGFQDEFEQLRYRLTIHAGFTHQQTQVGVAALRRADAARRLSGNDRQGCGRA